MAATARKAWMTWRGGSRRWTEHAAATGCSQRLAKRDRAPGSRYYCLSVLFPTTPVLGKIRGCVEYGVGICNIEVQCGTQTLIQKENAHAFESAADVPPTVCWWQINNPKALVGFVCNIAVSVVFCVDSRTLEAMERVKQNLRRRIQDSHEHAKVVAIILGILGFFNALFHNHSSKATSTFWRFLITFVVNLVPKTDYVCVLPSL